MIGAIAGDIIGSVYEHQPIKHTRFPLFGPRSTFTDDTVLTLAVADAILRKTGYAGSLKAFGRAYPAAGYGMSFKRWLDSQDEAPYNSWGNGSAMRVSPVGFAFDRVELVLSQARESAAATHNHPEGIKGAQAVALAVLMGRTGRSKTHIRRELTERFGYDLDRRLIDIRPTYRFDISCRGTVPEAVIAFLESNSFEEAVRNAISLGGDSDTLACICGGIAQAFYGQVPAHITREVRGRLPEALWAVVEEFNARFGLKC